jgi:hypothetical protein
MTRTKHKTKIEYGDFQTPLDLAYKICHKIWGLGVKPSLIIEPTDRIKYLAPKTWNYLEKYAQYLDYRKSKIYQQKPRFSIFGVGDYTFKPWKIDICGLYKQLSFRLVSKINSKPTIFDDTIYFLGFEDEKIARQTFNLLTSETAIIFYLSLIFGDEKRPIKASILNSLDLTALNEIVDAFNPQI